MSRLRTLTAGVVLSVVAASLVTASAASAAAITTAADGLDGTCASLRVYNGSSSVGYVVRSGSGYGFTSSASAATAFRLEATQLGRYELFGTDGKPAYQSVVGFILAGDSYGDRADFTVAKAGDRYRFTATATGEVMGSFLFSLGAAGSTSTVALATATGCYTPPDIDPGVSGTAAPGVDSSGRLVGTIDAHAHITAAAAFGGQMHCGEAWAPGGVQQALAGCDTHKSLNVGALFEAIVGGTDAVNSPEDGWPTFGDWPQHNSLLHEQSYYRSIERSWRAGQRVLNALLVANRAICELFPYRDTSCDEMDEIRVQARYLYSMQDYIDAQSGGAGKGWFRIATTPAQVRSIAAQGKLAVTIGVENSEIFGCREINGAAQCTTAQIDAGLDELQSLGVSGLYPVHKFDNAFGGTRFDAGLSGAFVNLGNLLSTGHWWTATSCTGPADNEQPLANDDLVKLLSLGVVGVPAGTVLPVYPTGKICNTRGLTDLGRYLIQKMMDRGMIIHVDHMSVKTVQAVLDLAAAAHYPGVTSVHSWADPAVIDRVLSLGGFVASYANAVPEFLSEWRTNRAGPHGNAITGYGFGTDVNGLGDQANPRPNAATSPLLYPFTAPNGTTVNRQVWGTRTFDVNTDGAAQYGLFADWTTDLIQQAGADGPLLRQQLMSGAESYVRMWEAAIAW
ncbi:membrane dipeptidase [Dactylosporangium vinaceum]|uniref:Membrane dipeptidase n=1 Tax=Dactylosporangium vinaceum TaxID=53362 RepID=A0ABV5MSC4_9ACTN|nr:membrane dipeptidase [Dactylosporangium vinaceum]UAC00183.1 membrane dipeptidase [Dactylosporangium vinaceum]